MLTFDGSIDIRAATQGDGKLATFTMNAYNGGLMKLEGWVYPIVIDLMGLKAAKFKIPVLRSHDFNRVVGHLDDVLISSRSVDAEGTISGVGEDAQEIVRSSINGFTWQASIGATPTRLEFLPGGKTTTINGQTISGPASIVRAGMLVEISFVPLGADLTTSTKVAAQLAYFFSEDQVVERVTGVENDETAEARRVALEVLRASRGSGPAARRVTPANALVAGLVLEAAACLAGGMGADFVAKHTPAASRDQVMNEAMSAGNRGTGIQTLMERAISAADNTYSGSRRDSNVIEAAFEADRMLRASGFSTISLSGILGNVANKSLLAAYEAVEAIWPFICGIRNHGDFKTHTQYRLDSTGSFRKVGPDGELKHAGLAEAAYTNKLDTYGVMLALTRQMMINDDLGAFLQLPTLLGRMAGVRIEEAVFVLLLSQIGSFFAAGNRNYMSGTDSALSIDALTTGVQKFSDAVDSNGKPILISPKILLTGTGLFTKAEQLYSTTQLNVTTTANKPQFAENSHKGLYRPYKSPYVNNTAIKDQDGNALTGQTSTGWDLFADPAVRAAIAVAFLNGQRTPTLESAQTDFNTLGMQWRCFHDFGVGMEDPNAAVWSAGA